MLVTAAVALLCGFAGQGDAPARGAGLLDTELQLPMPSPLGRTAGDSLALGSSSLRDKDLQILALISLFVGFGLAHGLIGDAFGFAVFLVVDSVVFGIGSLLYLWLGPGMVTAGAVSWLLLHLPQALDFLLKTSGGGFIRPWWGRAGAAFAPAQPAALTVRF